MGKNRGIQTYSGKNIVVLGMAKSGAAVARLLHEFGAQVTVNDVKDRKDCHGAEDLEKMGVNVICGHHPDDLIHPGVDLVVKNPGIPYTITPVQQALQIGIPIVTEIEVAYQISDAPIIAITGSNGKTTTTTLTGEILKAGGLKPVVAGNIGTVLSEKALEARPDQVLVSELSSFQLKGTDAFKPAIACLLNIYEAHLDYHGSMEDYIDSKMNIFRRQAKSDVAILNRDQKMLRELASQVPSRLFWFSRQEEVERGAFVKEKKIIYRDEQGTDHHVMDVHDIRMPGDHSLENVLAAVAIAGVAGVRPEVMKQVIASFKGVEHRIEFVDRINEVDYYNDSKATNPRATMTGLKAFDRPVVWIAGGLDRGIAFMDMTGVVSEKVRALITYGESAPKLDRMGKQAGIDERHLVDNVEEAVLLASRIARPGEVVLLSPACASWDMYTSFEERGRIFKQAVHNLRTSLS
ncbi:MAG: UDP-N-acetylmuramoyl-L-alanine--D-glutamate ligase [Bacillaceae bacterium]|nr:UDP-N-acetylmuramoyl-L-alanine--D-glutamate ligase [Bacillaceae bacterium]